MAPSLNSALSGRFMNITRRGADGGSDPSSLAGRQESFSQMISREANAGTLTKEQKARRTAEQFVASSLVEPILKQMRESSNVAPPFGPSQAEKQFRALLDTQIARNLVKRAHWPVVDRVAADLAKRSKGVTA